MHHRVHNEKKVQPGIPFIAGQSRQHRIRYSVGPIGQAGSCSVQGAEMMIELEEIKVWRPIQQRVREPNEARFHKLIQVDDSEGQ